LSRAVRNGEASILRFSIDAFYDANPAAELRFSRYNAGAARCHPQLGKAKRWIGFHDHADAFSGTVTEVTEAVVSGDIELPALTEISLSASGPWLTFGVE
jgi:hypothetical protein